MQNVLWMYTVFQIQNILNLKQCGFPLKSHFLPPIAMFFYSAEYIYTIDEQVNGFAKHENKDRKVLLYYYCVF